MLDAVAARLGSTPLAVALAWLLRRSPNILLIPGTSSAAHLRENVAAAALDLPADALAELDGIAAAELPRPFQPDKRGVASCRSVDYGRSRRWRSPACRGDTAPLRRRPSGDDVFLSRSRSGR